MKFLVSALILNTRSCQQAVKCALAMREQTMARLPDGRADKMEILVIDNHSGDDSIGVLRNRLSHLPNVRIIENNDNLGFGGGYNRGVHYAQGEYILINNPVKMLQPDGVELLLRKMEADPTIGMIAPALVHPDGTYRLSPRAFPKPLSLLAKRTFIGKLLPSRLRRYLQLDNDPTTERAVEWLAGGCFLMRREVFMRLGGFDERFFLFFEDTDLCRRIGEMGLKVVYYPIVEAADRKSRFSDGSILRLLCTKVGRAHLTSGIKYYIKWGF